MDITQDYERAVEACACAAHMANRAYCQAIGDESQPIWEEAPAWQRSSAINGVKAALNPEQTPRNSHEGWLAQKRAEGWRYGPVKDPDKKEHPCFVEYDELPAEQRVKDDIFLATVRSMARVLGLMQ